jgi:uncharacterized membrane protein affecting hemolysin expression
VHFLISRCLAVLTATHAEIFVKLRDRLALKAGRQADYAWTVVARVLSRSKNRGRITIRIGRTKTTAILI